MKKAYISSTYKDLIEYREAATKALRRIGYSVVCMEDYVARDERTVAACEADVAGCDIYVGIFAWRYGHIPRDGNEAGRSITEIEYRKASGEKTCLIFLLSENAPWPSTLRDAEKGEGDYGKRIRDLRVELKERCAGYFSSPSELATEVMAAAYQHESTRRVQRLEALDKIKETVDLGPSTLPNIQNKILEAQDAEIVEISLGPTPWWTTRLHLVAALACDFTRIQQFLLLDPQGCYLSMASPLEVRRALTQHFPQLERAYLESRSPKPISVGASAQEIEHIVMMYPIKVVEVCGESEQSVKQNISPAMISRDLGIEPSADAVERDPDQRRSLLQWEIVRRQKPFVTLLEEGRVVGVIDRMRMASDIATRALEQP